MSIQTKLMNIQHRLNAPKNLYNSYGNYSYRSAEGILEAVKPLLYEYGCTIKFESEIVEVADRIYIYEKAILTDTETGESIVAGEPAREPDTKKGMDSAQVTGATSSYAKKYALNSLFAIDDNKDADTNELHAETEARTQEPKIDAKNVEQITALADEKGVSLMAICERFNLGSIQDMTKTQFVKAVRMLEATKKKSEVA